MASCSQTWSQPGQRAEFHRFEIAGIEPVRDDNLPQDVEHCVYLRLSAVSAVDALEGGHETPHTIGTLVHLQRASRSRVGKGAMSLLPISCSANDDAARNQSLSHPLSPQVGVFDRAADTYDQLGVDMFQSVAEWLVVELSPVAGERALDIGCGCGAALARLARAVLPHGLAIGIDMSPRMVELAKADLEAAGVHAGGRGRRCNGARV